METDLVKEIVSFAETGKHTTADERGSPRIDRSPSVTAEPESASRGARALRAVADAEEFESRPEFRKGDRQLNQLDARRLRAESVELLKLEGPLVTGAGEAIIQPASGSDPRSVDAFFRETLTDPDSISVYASTQRMNAALDVGVLQLAVDTAASAGAANSLEKMLCHQAAGAHKLAMKLLAKADEFRLPPVEAARLANAAARMMDVYQNACITLQKLKTKGTQRVVVQYQQVNVATGGQAVVAATVGRGALGRGKRRDAT